MPHNYVYLNVDLTSALLSFNLSWFHSYLWFSSERVSMKSRDQTTTPPKKKHNEKKTSLNRRKLEYSRVLFKPISSINQSIYQSIDQSSNQSINHYIISRTVSIYPFLSRHSIFDKYTPDISSHTSIHLNLTHYFYFFNTLFYLVKQSKSNHYRY